MKAVWPWLQAGAASLGGIIGWFLGDADGFLYALIVFTVIDYISGVLCAVLNKNLCSEIGARGIVKKVMIFMLVGVAHVIDSQIIGENSALRTTVIFFYISNEGISLLENAARLGLPIPQKLKDILSLLHHKDGKGGSGGDRGGDG